MSRIRTIKPEFWSAEQVMDLSIPARLAFAGLWNFCDDRGVHPASAKTLKAEVFPSDDLTSDEVGALVGEMISQGLVAEFEAEGRRWWWVTGWARHQKIDRPTFKHPPPPETDTAPRDFAEPSSNARRVLAEPSPPEGRLMETNGEKPNGASAPVAVNGDALEAPRKKPATESNRLNGKTAAIEKIFSYLNFMAHRNYRTTNPNGTPTAHAVLVAQRLREGYTVDDFMMVIGVKAGEWRGDEKMDRCLNPETLFRKSHFARYLAEAEAAP
jgi:uncharacterized phage protein (TIGR02220 family)